MSLNQNIKNLNASLNRYKSISIFLGVLYVLCMVLSAVYLGNQWGGRLANWLYPPTGEDVIGLFSMLVYLGVHTAVAIVLTILGVSLWARGRAVLTLVCCAVLIAVSFPTVSDVLRRIGILPEPYEVSVIGYNYIDRAIATFSVNGSWGGNLELSDLTSGGGSPRCCISLPRSTKTPFWVDVRYQKDALESYPPRKEIEPAGDYINTKVEVTGPIPAYPEYIEIHFYPDGHIEAALSGENGPSPPRLQLERRFPYLR